MRNRAFWLSFLLLAGCTAAQHATGPAPGTAPTPAPAPAVVEPAPKPLDRYVWTRVGADTYFITLPPGMDANSSLAAAATPAGIAWLGLQPRTGEGLFTRPTEPLVLYLSPAVQGGGDLTSGAQVLYTFPLTVPYTPTGADQYITGGQVAAAGDWVAVFIYLRVPGNNQGPARLDAVNLTTHEHPVLTEAHDSGGRFFRWRAESNRVYWEQSGISGPDVKVTASKVMDLATGEVSDAPFPH